MTQPVVSICMPAFNAGRFIDQAISSLRAQTFEPFELLILDDGSNDLTWEIARRHETSDSRIRVLRNDRNRGLVYTRNRLLEEASAGLIAAADADDVFEATRLQQQVDFLRTHNDVGVVGGNVRFRDEAGAATREPSKLDQADAAIRFFLLLGPCLWNTVTTYRKEPLLRVGGYRNGFDSGAEDYDLWCRLSRITKLANLSSILATVNIHDKSVTASEDATKSNIYGVAKPMLSDYLGRDVALNDAKDLILLFWNGLGTRSDISNMLALACLLKTTAKQREQRDTYRLLATRMHDALWKQAQAGVYANRRQSMAAMKLALSLCPLAVTNSTFPKYLLRWLTPDWIRGAVKSHLGAA